MKVAWIAFNDPFVYGGGGELSQRQYIAAGRARGHQISVHGFLRRRAQRAVRGLLGIQRLEVPDDADLYVLSNVRNMPDFPTRLPEKLIDEVLATGRAAILEEAWVDLCEFDVPCDGDPSRCRPDCDRAWSRRFFSRAAFAIFNSPLSREVHTRLLGESMPDEAILARPGIDVTRFRNADRERDIDVLYVGTISAAKGYYNLLERFGSERLTLVGPNALGTDVSGSWLGRAEYEELPAIFNRARTFAHLPRWLEPMGRAVVEAALCGCEVIVNDRVGVASYPRADWTDPETISRSGERLWREIELAVERTCQRTT